MRRTDVEALVDRVPKCSKQDDTGTTKFGITQFGVRRWHARRNEFSLTSRVSRCRPGLQAGSKYLSSTVATPLTFLEIAAASSLERFSSGGLGAAVSTKSLVPSRPRAVTSRTACCIDKDWRRQPSGETGIGLPLDGAEWLLRSACAGGCPPLLPAAATPRRSSSSWTRAEASRSSSND